MHELGLMMSVIENVEESARDAGACSVLGIHLVIGEMTEVVRESLEFAFEVLSEGTLSEGADLVVEEVGCASHCNACGMDFEHDRFHLICPECGSYDTTITSGRDLYIKSIEVDLPDEADLPGVPAGEGTAEGDAPDTESRSD